MPSVPGIVPFEQIGGRRPAAPAAAAASDLLDLTTIYKRAVHTESSVAELEAGVLRRDACLPWRA